MFDPENKEEINQAIGSTIRRYRFERGMTLEEASHISGVSKSMLAQIERGESSPTIAVLWKIASGLRISFSELLSQEDQEGRVIHLSDLEPVKESEGKMVLHTLFPFNPISGFEYFYITMDPGAFHRSQAHANAFEEYLVVVAGRMVITLKDRDYILDAPCAFSFKPNVEHIYSNPFEERAVFQNIVKY